ncbi:MAG: ATP-dependent protease domain protein (EC [uncultured Paraburkholderia sp.]|nr:MAG: ATP-dependent protease domain protein (EC [uncultured Paraburkholderia sp.]CAH2909798.1 MAG: ATP-dependent protease domain protein (EC [uncultured Paraburkholderia sp.]
MLKQEIAVASFSRVYDLDQVETALNDLGEGANDALRTTYEKMLKTGNMRLLREAEPHAVDRRSDRRAPQIFRAARRHP